MQNRTRRIPLPCHSYRATLSIFFLLSHWPSFAPRNLAARSRWAERARSAIAKKKKSNYSGGLRADPARSAFEVAEVRESLERCAPFVAAASRDGSRSGATPE